MVKAALKVNEAFASIVTVDPSVLVTAVVNKTLCSAAITTFELRAGTEPPTQVEPTFQLPLLADVCATSAFIANNTATNRLMYFLFIVNRVFQKLFANKID